MIDLGGKHLRFIIAPFLHWPDTMFTLLEEDGVLFTCDAFGAHYCGTSIFSDELPDYSDEMKFYFDCIMRPFKDKALAAIDKIRGERIEMLCPSHGPIYRQEPWRTIDTYEEWCSTVGDGKKVVIFYLSPHGNTEKMAEAVAKGAANRRGDDRDLPYHPAFAGVYPRPDGNRRCPHLRYSDHQPRHPQTDVGCPRLSLHGQAEGQLSAAYSAVTAGAARHAVWPRSG